MSDRGSISKRLTWDPAWPSPFESLWSIVAKVMVLNNLTWADLVKLIRHRDTEQRTSMAIDGARTAWIDFERFGALLGVEPSRLKQGCWDQLGISVLKTATSIRICPECWKENLYHCLFFDLSALSACPWHKCALTAPCCTCVSATTFALRSRQGMPSSRFCAACYRSPADVGQIIAAKRMEGGHKKTVRNYCNSLLIWWDILGARFPARDQLLRNLLTVGELKPDELEYLAWQRYVALRVMKDKTLPWKLDGNVVPVNYAEWIEPLKRHSPDDQRGPDRLDRIQQEPGKCYRSLKSYLYKTYVRKHGHCYRQLLGLKREDALALNGDGICLPAFAYLIWRMSIEGVVWIEGLRVRRPSNYPLRLMMVPQYPMMSLHGRLRWSYCSFFAIWYELASLCGVRNFRVALSSEQYDAHLHYQCCTTSDERDEPDWPTEVHLHILFPHPSELKRKGDLACAANRKGNSSPVDRSQQNQDSRWGWAHDESGLRKCLFQVRHPPQGFRARGQFWYVNV